jgi:hypothetical protein
MALIVLAGLAWPTTAAGEMITTTLEGCVAVTDARLADARWFANGTFRAVAFDDDTAGCDPTIADQIQGAYLFDEDRIANTLEAWLNLDNLPRCGRRQYDLHLYLDNGVLDPMGLKSLVIDTGIDCPQPFDGSGLAPDAASDAAPTPAAVPEPGTLGLVAVGASYLWSRRRRLRESQPKGLRLFAFLR